MSESEKKIDILTTLLEWFINSQRSFNATIEVKINSTSNQIKILDLWLQAELKNLEEKIDKIQYFLEEALAANMDTLLSEDAGLWVRIGEIEWSLKTMKSSLYDMSVDIWDLQKV